MKMISDINDNKGYANKTVSADSNAIMTSSAVSLDPLLAPQSVALIGASEKTGSYGKALLDMLIGGGFGGAIYPVNPGYVKRPGEYPFYARMADLPAAPDHTVISVGTGHLEDAFAAAIRAGTRAATIFADTRDKDQKSRISDMAREAGIPLIGPNSMGCHNFDLKMRITPFPVPLDLKPGGIAAILQSGSVLGALVNNDRRFRFNTVISTGSESITTAADYLHWVIDRPTTRVVGIFLEAVRDPESFLHGLERAAHLDIPVVILKVGRSEAGARMALSHTGAIVGNHDIFRAASESRGAHLVDTVDELAALLQVFSQDRRAAQHDEKTGIATIHDSGGERELIADLAEDLNVPFARLTPATLEKIEAVLEPEMDADNPLDAWGTGHNADEMFFTSFKAMLDDPAVAAGVYMLDWRQNYHLHEMHEEVLYRINDITDKPVIAGSLFALTDNAEMASRMADRHIPLIEGSREILIAMRHLLNHGRQHVRQEADQRENPAAAEWRQRIPTSPMTEDENMALIAAYGINTPKIAVATNRDEALAAASAIGGPVVLKTLAEGVHHKTEKGGVHVNLTSTEAIIDAYDDLAGRLSPRVLVAAMAAAGFEMALGAVNDRDFGMAVMISAGGIGVEMFDDKLILMPPFSAETVLAHLPQMKSYRMLTGYRGKPPLALHAFAEMAARFSSLVDDLGDVISTADINPVIINTEAAVAVDALILPKE